MKEQSVGSYVEAARHTAAGEDLGTSRWRREFPGAEIQLRQVRRWIESLLPAGPSRDSVISIACEYASNALIHSRSSKRGGHFVVELAGQGCGSTVRIMVSDCGGRKEPRLAGEPYGEYEEHGRGLPMVEKLSARWGISGDENGRTFWSDVIWVTNTAPAPHVPAAPERHDQMIIGQEPLRQGRPDRLPRFGCARPNGYLA